MIPGINASGRFDPLTRVYRDRLVARSGTISAASIDAVDTLVRASRTGGWDTGLRLLWVMAGSNTAARRTAIVGGGTNGVISTTGSFTTDSETQGMIADSSLGTNADLGVNLAGSLAVTISCDILQVGSFLAGDEQGNWMGAYRSGDTGFGTILGYYSPTLDEADGIAYFAMADVGSNIDVATTTKTGLFTGVSGTDTRMYNNDTLLGTAAIIGSNPGVRSGNFMAWTVGDQGSVCDWGFGTFAIWDVALTGAQVASFHAAHSAFKAAIGRS